MKAYYWSDLSGYVISDKSMSHRTKNLSKRMNIDTYSFTDFRFHFFIDFDCHQFRLFFFSKQIFISRDGKLKSPLFFFCFAIEKLWIKIVWTIGWRSNFISGNSNEDPSSFLNLSISGFCWWNTNGLRLKQFHLYYCQIRLEMQKRLKTCWLIAIKVMIFAGHKKLMNSSLQII